MSKWRVVMAFDSQGNFEGWDVLNPKGAVSIMYGPTGRLLALDVARSLAQSGEWGNE